MQYVLRATRALINAATTLHIAGLKGQIANQREVVRKARLQSDVAGQAVKAAKAEQTYARKFEKDVSNFANNVIQAARQEAQSLRRDASI